MIPGEGVRKPCLALSAVIPSAGFSSRMHQFKPLLKFGKLAMVEAVIRLFQQCGIQDILVVTGYNHSLVEPIIQKTGARAVFNPGFETGMLGSIQTGVAQVSRSSQGFFLLPVDIPAIRPSTLFSLAEAFEKNSEALIIPEFNQESGHPPLIPARLIPEIIGMDGDSNLGELLLAQKAHLTRHPVHDRGILLDADTQAAYETLAKRYRDLDIPDKEECTSLIGSVFAGETDLPSHLSTVARVALTLCDAIERNPDSNQQTGQRISLNRDLVQAAALLHDIKRKEKNHARVGGDFLKTLGFFRVAEIVAAHMTLVPGDCITEKEIVYFADKICAGHRVVLDYSKRFADKIQQIPKAEKQILQRYEATRQIQTLIEAAAGHSLEQIVQ
jgi:CTP:molybdopterin cytidylyltransferase MocA/HD superfamily phosphodiesterase